MLRKNFIKKSERAESKRTEINHGVELLRRYKKKKYTNVRFKATEFDKKNRGA